MARIDFEIDETVTLDNELFHWNGSAWTHQVSIGGTWLVVPADETVNTRCNAKKDWELGNRKDRAF